MPCASLSTGFSNRCLTGIGGGFEIFFVNKEELETGVTIDGTSEKVTALPSGLTVYRYRPLKNSVNWTEVPTASQENGTLFFANSLSFRLGGLSDDKRLELVKLMSTPTVAFVRLNSDKLAMIGYHEGLQGGGNWQSGVAKADFQGYEITLTADEPHPAYYLNDFTDEPFDNFVDVTVDPPYSVES